MRGKNVKMSNDIITTEVMIVGVQGLGIAFRINPRMDHNVLTGGSIGRVGR